MLNEIVICEYNNEWAQHYLDEKNKILHLLQPEEIIKVEHFGSTSIPNLAAKPIIDILIGFNLMEDYFSRKLLILIMCISLNTVRNIGKNH